MAREIARQISPPIAVAAVRRLRLRATALPEWQYVGTSWPQSPPARGWNVPSVVEAQRSRWPALEQAVGGNGLLAGDDLPMQNTLLAYAYVVGRAAAGESHLSILDWGGGLGQYGLIARRLFPELEIEYHCHDLPLMVEAGRTLLPGAQFHGDDGDTFVRAYDLVVASSSLQYAEDWGVTLSRLAASTARWLYVTRHPIVPNSKSYIVVQRPLAHGYATEYLGWVLNRTEFLAAAQTAGMTLRREFLIGEEPIIPGAPEQPAYRGFLFERVSP